MTMTMTMTYIQEVDCEWELDRDAVSVDSSCVLGEGEFGRVVKATLMRSNSAAGVTVAVKMLKGFIHNSLTFISLSAKKCGVPLCSCSLFLQSSLPYCGGLSLSLSFQSGAWGRTSEEIELGAINNIW